MTLRRLFPLLVLVTLTAASCTSRWSRADDFVGRLRCGMTVDEVKRLAGEYGRTTVYQSRDDDFPELVVKQGGTRVHCEFVRGGLQAVKVTWISRPMYVTEEPRIELCAR